MEPEELRTIGKDISEAFSSIAEDDGRLTSEQQRFKLWAHSLGLFQRGHASLDYRLRDAVAVRGLLLEILRELESHVGNFWSISMGKRLPYESDAADTSSDTVSSDEAEKQEDTSAASSEGSFHEVDFRCRSISENIDALYSLAVKIRSPRYRLQRATEDLYKNIPADTRDEYRKGCEEVETAIVAHRHREQLLRELDLEAAKEEEDIINDYTSTDHWLIRRTGIANARRKQQFVYWKEHDKKMSHEPTEEEQPVPKQLADLPTKRLISPSQPVSEVSLPKLKSLATSATKLHNVPISRDDLTSVLSHESRVSTAMNLRKKDIEWPLPPNQPVEVKYFKCPHCRILCPRRYLKPDVWRSHLIHDLQPYHCTYEKCHDPNRTYSTRQDWLDHENLHLRVWHCQTHGLEFETQTEYIDHLQQAHFDASDEQLRSPELIASVVGPSVHHYRDCPLCPTEFSDVVGMQKHMALHLERLALILLSRQSELQEDGSISGRESDSNKVEHLGREGSIQEDFSQQEQAEFPYYQSKIWPTAAADEGVLSTLVGSDGEKTMLVPERLQELQTEISAGVYLPSRGSLEILSWLSTIGASSEPLEFVEDDFARAPLATTDQGEPVLVPDLEEGLKNKDSFGAQKYSTNNHGVLVESSDEEDDLSSGAPLHDQLLAGHHMFSDRRGGFIPRGHINEVITEKAVTQNLQECLISLSPSERIKTVQPYVNQIFQGGRERKSYIKVFAILALIEKTECIGDFLRQGIDDSDLPFQRYNPEPRGHTSQFWLRSRRGGGRIRAFDRLSMAKRVEFDEWQWAVDAPVFDYNRNGEPKIFSFREQVILPFIRYKFQTREYELEESPDDFGKVAKRHIHPDHHNLKGGGKLAFGIKKQGTRRYNDFKAEFDMLARFSKGDHPHLVSLLGAYIHLNNHYFIFDWADSNLARYWEKHSDPNFDIATVSWVAGQCAVLASGLQQIHRSARTERSQSSRTESKVYEYGNITPASVLWFSNPNSLNDRGTFKLCTFSQFLTEPEEDNHHDHVSFNYYAPESQWKDQNITWSYDMWSMGCLYLDFLAWLLGGWKIVRKTANERSDSLSDDDGPHSDLEQPYFDLGDSEANATLKPAVTKFIKEAHANPKCSEFIHEFLDIIQDHLLIIETNGLKRMGCDRLYHRLQEMWKKCKDIHGYAVEARPRVG
ncbi:hypothetical protein FSARC_10090 [Fusarium sarcochroum]|uniref:Protein kinase domain-containing protein n=1 Tax=Fusarium sarcochroum TaxID=1208366 RepID=A0A8H4TQ17_9HYPO|nr:hypothetical protein FSARC_10090 [Fusarium sarcochroum]